VAEGREGVARAPAEERANGRGKLLLDIPERIRILLTCVDDPQEFIDKWSRADRTERQAAQEHFIDLCRVLGEPTPNEAADPDGYTFEKASPRSTVAPDSRTFGSAAALAGIQEGPRQPRPRLGLIATKSIAGGASRLVLEPIAKAGSLLKCGAMSRGLSKEPLFGSLSFALLVIFSRLNWTAELLTKSILICEPPLRDAADLTVRAAFWRIRRLHFRNRTAKQSK